MVREAAPGSESGFEVFGAKFSIGSKLETEQPDKIQMPINPMKPMGVEINLLFTRNLIFIMGRTRAI
jgi:hypothetical protein